jgi:hypothetical protein
LAAENFQHAAAAITLVNLNQRYPAINYGTLLDWKAAWYIRRRALTAASAAAAG